MPTAYCNWAAVVEVSCVVVPRGSAASWLGVATETTAFRSGQLFLVWAYPWLSRAPTPHYRQSPLGNVSSEE